MRFGFLLVSVIFWIMFYLLFMGKITRNPRFYSCQLFIKNHLIKKNSFLRFVFIFKCNSDTPHIDYFAYSLLSGAICILIVLILSILKLILNVNTNELLNHPLNVGSAIVLFFEFVSFVVTLFVFAADNKKCEEEMKKMTHEERLKIDKEIMKEYPDFWKRR